MDLPNLATVICPSILYARGRDALRDETFSALKVVTSLLEHQDEFFLVPAEFLPILQDQDYFMNALDLPSKEFLKKCATYMQVKNNGRPTPGTPFNGPNGGLGSNGSQRYPAPLSPSMERPPPIGLAASDRSGRPSPNISQQGGLDGSSQGHGDYYPPPHSPIPHSSMQNMPPLQRTPPMGGTNERDQWAQGMQQMQQSQNIIAPRPIASNGPNIGSSSRPSSVIGSRTPVHQNHPNNQGQGQGEGLARPGVEQQGSFYGSPNGYSTPMRQRT
jgi:hypothetical protein